MQVFAFPDADGYPTGAGQHPTTVPEGAVALTGGWGLHDLRRLMLQGGQWVARPVLPGPSVDGGDLWFDGLPEQAVITVTDAITDQPVSLAKALPWAGGLGITLTQGSYLVRITAPDPWLDYEGLFEIDGGDPQRALDALANAKRAARAQINAAAGRARLALVTDIPGQQAIYQAKEAEARAYLAAGAPDDLSDFPAIAAEIGITAPTAYQLAQVWLHMAHQFRQAAAESERARLTALKAVDAATSIDALEAILHPAPRNETTKA